MKKIQFQLDSWEKGRDLIKNISQKVHQPFEERDDTLVIENSNYKISVHLDERNFSFVTFKFYNDDSIDLIKDFIPKEI